MKQKFPERSIYLKWLATAIPMAGNLRGSLFGYLFQFLPKFPELVNSRKESGLSSRSHTSLRSRLTKPTTRHTPFRRGASPVIGKSRSREIVFKYGQRKAPLEDGAIYLMISELLQCKSSIYR